MLQETYQATAGGLLHDIGKIIFRAQHLDGRAHPKSGYEAIKLILDQPEILHSIRYHHKKDILQSKISDDDMAFLVYIADNIASGADRRSDEEEQAKGFDKAMPLENIYNLMNQNNARLVHEQGSMDKTGGISFPQESEQTPPYTAAKYNALYQALYSGLKQIEYTPQYVDSLLALLESYMTYVPSSTNRQEVADISLYDHSKITAAIAACLYLYLREAERNDYREVLFKQEKQFMDEKAFLMFSCDLSGIQSFIYTTSGEGALKTLRARSLYLEVLLEHVADELLQKVGLSRANLIYTGGGHAYLLLPNTTETQRNLTESTRCINHWFIKHFDNDLYLATAWQPCSGNDLMNKGQTKDAYQQIFRSLSQQLSAKKLSRYTIEELTMLNQQDHAEDRRECKECKRSAALMEEDICSFCSNVKSISAQLIKGEGYFAVLREPITKHGVLPLPNIEGEDVYLQIMDEKMMRENLHKQQTIRFYSKNKLVTGRTMATNIWMGDYHVRNEHAAATFEHLAQSSQGIKRIGVLRADVDNLGQAFVSGFLRPEEAEPAKYLTISRTATFSRSLSLFFKYHLNAILAGTAHLPFDAFSLDGAPKTEPRQVNIIYSGGDDLFLVGAWQEIIECAIDIQKAFALYTQGTLTISAGVGIFAENYPLIRMAEETGELEEQAKKLDASKNAIALFGKEIIGSQQIEHCYHWAQFENEVVGEKLRFLQNHLGTKQGDEQTNTAFIYQILELLRHADEQINVARFAYTLARRAEIIKDKTLQKQFCDKMYAWYLDEKQRNQLMTAIYLYVYLYRK